MAEQQGARRRRAMAMAAALLLAIAPMVRAADPNGCGTGWNAYLVPDSVKLANCEFRDSCDAHDVCYDKCNAPGTSAAEPAVCAYLDCRKGGRLFHADGAAEVCRSAIYEESERQAQQRKNTCDQSFYMQLRSRNRGKLICEAFSMLYLKAVEKFGEGAFFGAAPAAQGKEGEIPFSSGSREAIEKFFNSGNERQFRALLRDLEGANPALDPGQPMRVDPGGSLKNDR